MEKIIVDSSVEEVKFYINGAIVTRKALLGGGHGQVRVVLDNVEDSVDPKSIRAYLSSGYVRNVSYETYKKKPEGEEVEEKELKKKLRKLKRRREVLSSRIKGLEAYIASIDQGFTSAITAFMATVSTGRADVASVLESARRLREDREKALEELVEVKFRLEEVEREIEEIESRLKRGVPLVQVGRIILDVERVSDENIELRVSYVVWNAYWHPFYDVFVDEEKVRVNMYARLVQGTSAVWRSVKPFITSKKIGRVQKVEPSPWYIRLRRYEEEMTMAEEPPRVMAAKVLPPRHMKVEKAAPKPSFQKAEVILGEYIAFRAPSPVDLEPNKPLLILLSEYSFDGEVKVFLDAFTQQDPVEFVEFKNTSNASLPPGPARIYKGEIFVGETSLGQISPGQEVELALTEADLLETKRRQIVSRASKTFVGGKAVLRRGYRLTLKSHYKSEVKVEVYDRIPVSEEPEVKVELKEANPQPAEEPRMGILKWELALGPGEEKEIYFEFEVTYPAEDELEGI